MPASRSVVLTSAGISTLRLHPLTKVQHIILWHLVETLPPAGEVLSVTNLGETLAIGRVQALRAMKTLLAARFILRGPRMGVPYHYRLNPALFRVLS